jgi:hypothetical protein
MAEFALAGVLALYKQLPFFLDRQRAGGWEKRRDLRELAGRAVTVLGCGSVGTECAKRFAALGCAVSGVDLFPREDPSYAAVRPLEELDRLLPESDVLILTLPLTPDLAPHDIPQVFTSALCALGDHGGHHGIYAAIGISESTATPPSVLWSAILGVHCALCENNIPALPPVWHPANTGDEIIALCLIARTPATLPSQDAPTIMKEEKTRQK